MEHRWLSRNFVLEMEKSSLIFDEYARFNLHEYSVRGKFPALIALLNYDSQITLNILKAIYDGTVVLAG